MMKRSYVIPKLCFISEVLFATCLLLACASTPPSKSLPQAKVAVASVDHANYRNHVDSEVTAVVTKLKQAQAFEANKDHTNSEQLAQQILADVEWIQIKAQRLIIEHEVKQLEDSVVNLNQELKWREPVEVSPLNN